LTAVVAGAGLTVGLSAGLVFAHTPASRAVTESLASVWTAHRSTSIHHLSPERSALPGLRMVEGGLQVLLDRYAEPLQASDLLQAAWDGTLEAAQDTVWVEQARAPFPVEETAAWMEFTRRFAQLTATGADPERLGQAATRAMARRLNDCHTHFV
ncbi:MAG TPA: hypothetical protein VGW38_28515, partial [Chloroflexota bacterium]|nr:hypothetical protein [Chloroflexota bacterium]